MAVPHEHMPEQLQLLQRRRPAMKQRSSVRTGCFFGVALALLSFFAAVACATLTRRENSQV
jgi:hypothetical protein